MMIGNDILKSKLMEYGISPLPENPVNAMAYVPYQDNNEMYSAEQGIVCGTMFPILNKPFLAGKWGKNV